MPQSPVLRLLFASATSLPPPPSLVLSPFRHSSSFSLFIKPSTPLSHRKYSYPCTCLASSSSRKQRAQCNPFNPAGRSNSSLRASEKREKGLLMAETESVVGFNRKRAEGKDKSDRPKDLKLKVRKLNPTNTISYVQILGTGMDTQDTSPSVLLFFDKQRFIFNAGEGLQRFCTEHKIKLSKIDHIFLSRVCSETVGGLPGLLLTLAGMGEEGMSVNVWGPSDLKYLVDAMKSFIPNAAMVHTHSFGSLAISDAVCSHEHRKFDEPLVLIDDEVVKISAFLLQPNDVAALKHGDMSVIYLCELPEIKGKFDPKKAQALGLKPGRKYGELQRGISVKSDLRNIMVHPNDVLGPSLPGPIVLLVDCPTSSHLQELLRVKSLSDYYADGPGKSDENSKIVNCVIHLTPLSVVNTDDYRKWMSRFGVAKHIIAGHEVKNVEVPILKSSARIATRLNYLCPQLFPSPGAWPLHNKKCSASASTDSVAKVCEIFSAQNLLKYHLRPYAQLGLDTSGIPTKSARGEIVDELLAEIPEIVEAAEEVAKFWHEDKEAEEEQVNDDEKKIAKESWLNETALPSCLENISREDLEIVLLGTGSSQPSKYRNVSSIFINLFSKGSLLLDCGEGTLGQLKRRFGIEGANEAVRGLKCIWISHIHADHHTGLAGVLALRRDLLKGIAHEPLIVIGPRQLKRFIDAYERLEDLDMLFLDCRHTTESSPLYYESNQNQSTIRGCSNLETPNGSTNEPLESTLFARGSQMQSHWKRSDSPADSSVAHPIMKDLKDILRRAGLNGLVSFPVVHCPQAFGVILKAADRVNTKGKTIPGWKVVYSGDTRPCPEVVNASRGATILIHEATFEDGMLDEAISRNHSTTKEAVEVGDSAGVYRIILTHFSQRYPKIPVFDDLHNHKTCIAFDMMSVNLADLHALPRVVPYLKLLFRDEMATEESEEVSRAVVTSA